MAEYGQHLDALHGPSLSVSHCKLVGADEGVMDGNTAKFPAVLSF